MIRKALSTLAIGTTLMITAIAVPPAGAAVRAVRVRPVVVRPFRPYPFSAWNYPIYRPEYVVVPATGEIKIDTHIKNELVYADGGYAGPSEKLKKFSLRPGNHDIEVRSSSGAVLYHQRVQVLVGKTVEIKPDHAG